MSKLTVYLYAKDDGTKFVSLEFLTCRNRSEYLGVAESAEFNTEKMERRNAKRTELDGLFKREGRLQEERKVASRDE